MVYDLALEENKKMFKSNDPDSFPIYDLSFKYKSESDYKSIYTLEKNILFEFEDLIGSTLKLKQSNIKHQDSGNGVFLSSYKRRFITPGTLIGFYPGVIYPSNTSPRQTSIKGTLQYLRRCDNFWVDPTAEIPYPLMDCITLDEFMKKKSYLQQRFQISDNVLNYINIPMYLTNPLALGHLINHPPPDLKANVKFIDFFVPINFFPRVFCRYFPNIMASLKKVISINSARKSK